MNGTGGTTGPAADGLPARLAAIVGGAHVLTDPAAMSPFLTDQRGRYTGRALAVVKPAAAAEVAAVVRACAEAGVAMVPQGGNTGLCGAATPPPGGAALLINLSRLDRIRALDTGNDAIHAEAGCTLAAVQRAAAAAGRLFPLALASGGSCEIGGALSTNAGGIHVLRYGNMRDLTLGLEAVLPDGRLWNGLRALRKDNSGYDLKQLFIGAEGTLGIITAATLKLFPAPRTRASAWAAVPGPAAALALFARLRAACGERVTAFELVGQALLELVLEHIPRCRPPLSTPAPWAVLMELTDTAAGAPLAELLARTLEAAIAAGEITDAALAATLAQGENLWALRENANEAQKREGFSIKHDISVPLDRIAEFIARAGDALRTWLPGVRIVAFGHIGDGNLHYNLFPPRADAAFAARAAEANRIVYDLVDALGGSISAEHGIGQLKREEIRRYKSAVELDLMRAVKHALDPRGLMNPGKVL